MWCRIFLSIIAISYLMCVLLLSGLQKEDLDVNMLRKLQRHNVNIDDMNNEDLRHQCVSTSPTDVLHHSNPMKTNDNQNYRTTEVTTETHKITNSVELDLNTMIKYFIKSRKSPDLIVEEESDSSTKTQADTTESILYSSYTHRNEPSTEISYTKSERIEKNKLDNLMEVINNFTRMSLRDKVLKRDVTPNPKDVEKFTNIDIVKNNNMGTSEVDYISKIIAEYINAHTTTVTATFPTTTTTIKLNIDTISQHIDSFLRNNPIFGKAQHPYNVLISNTNTKKHKDDKTSRNSFDLKDIDKSNNLNNDDSERMRIKNKAIKYVSDILQTDRLRKDAPFINYAQSVTQVPFVNDTQLESKNILQDSNNLYTILEKDNSKKKDVWRNLPPETIKEIAESVKAIVLKDLQNEIFSTTPQVTTISSTVTTKFYKQDQGNLQEATHVIEKFMEMFQHFKSIKESTIISGDTKFKMTEQKHVKQQYNGPVKLMYPPIMTPVNYGMRSKDETFPPMFINQFQQNFKVNTPIGHNLEIEKQSTVNKLNMYKHKAETPITLQTNSDEIPPLGIPISKPVKLMNQNIIVTTKHPFKKPINHRQYPDFMQQIGHNYNKNNNEMRNELLNTYTNRARESHGFSRNEYRDHEVNTFSNTGRERSKYINNYRDRTRSSYYTPHYDQSDYERMRVRNQKVKKFHERLERVDGRTKDSREDKLNEDGEESYKYKVASRQQQSLNDAKSSRYDDTHFRNFLKTQQKVNDMLERILATKTKSQGPSVEIP